MKFIQNCCLASRSRRHLPVVVFIGLSLACSCAADDHEHPQSWPFIRGATYDGHSPETDLIDEWPPEGPPVLWQRELGQGYSAFVASNGRVFTQAQSMAGQFVYCLDASSGRTIWRHRYDWAYESAGVYPGPRATPTLWKNRLFFVSPDGLLRCLQQSDGAVMWTVSLGDRYGIKGAGFGYSCSPTIADDMVLIPAGSAGAAMVALDAKSGREIWANGNDEASYVPAYPVKRGNQKLVIGYLQNALVIYDRNSGTELQRLELSSGYDEHSAWPIYQEPYLWITGPFRSGSRVLDLSANLSHSVWQSRLLSNDVCSSVCVDGYLYGFDIVDVQSKTHRPSRGLFRCLELETGKTCWETGSKKPWRSLTDYERATRIGQCCIIAADRKLVNVNEVGELILLATDPRQCRELARCSILPGELTWTAPCLYGKRLYVRNQSQAVCIYLGDPANTADTEIAGYAGDLSQQNWIDPAEFLLPVEPEYAFDIPSDRWLWQWLIACTSMLLAGYLIVWFIQRPHFDGRFGTLPMAITFFLGATGTTVLGHVTGEFVFTWPLCLYVTFAWVNQCGYAATDGTWLNALKRRVPIVILIAVCGGYFLICRRLSLVFEWAFLTGFTGVFPMLPIVRHIDRNVDPVGSSRTYLFGRIATGVLGLVLFFAASTAFLKWRY